MDCFLDQVYNMAGIGQNDPLCCYAVFIKFFVTQSPVNINEQIVSWAASSPFSLYKILIA